MTPIIGGIIEAGLKVLEKVIPDPEARARAQLELMRLEQEGQFRELEARMSAIVAEAGSADPWTSRARPSFLYVIYILLLASIPAGALHVFFPVEMAQGIDGFQAWLAAIPGELYALFGAGYLGYAGVRSFEKAKGVAS
jgi:Holin of 3TMs, for gene-transfer release